MTKFVIRDDDIGYFTDVDNTRKLYDYTFLKKYKISASVIPKEIKTFNRGNISNFIQEKKYKYIGGNKPLIKQLNRYIQEGNLEILQHGYTHEYFHKNHILIPECISEEKIKLEKNILKGKIYLERLFNSSVDSFVPPSNKFNGNTIKILNKLKFKYLSGTINPVFNHPLSVENIINWIKYLLYLIINYPHRYPYILKSNGIKEITYYVLNPDTRFEDIQKSFDYCINKNANFVLVIHQWEISQNISLYNKYIKFLKYVSTKNTKPSLFSELF